MKTIKETFEEYYVPIEVAIPGKKGVKIEYEYVGPKYYFRKKDSDISTVRKIAGSLTVLAIVVYFSVSLIYSPVNYLGYAWIYAAFALIPIVFQAAGVIELWVAGEYLTELNFHGIRGKLMIAPFIAALSLVVGAIIGFVEIIKWAYATQSIVVAAGFLIAGAVEMILSVYIRKIPFYKK